MTKKEAILIFGQKQVDLARALGRTKQAICKWPETLTEDQTSLVLGTALRIGKTIPEHLYRKHHQ